LLSPDVTKFDFGWGSAPDPAVGDYSALPGPLAGFKKPTSKEKKAMGREREDRGRKGPKGRGSGGEGVDIAWPDD